MFLTLSLVSCNHLDQANSCPQPPPVLLQREPSLAEINPLKMPLSQQEALTLWAKDVAQYGQLRERHSDLQAWVKYWCLSNSGKK